MELIPTSHHCEEVLLTYGELHGDGCEYMYQEGEGREVLRESVEDFRALVDGNRGSCILVAFYSNLPKTTNELSH